MQKLAALFFALLAGVAQAGPRTSANYSIITDTNDGGGMRGTSAAYTNDGSVGGAGGLGTVAAPTEVNKSGYAGQLYEIAGMTLNSASVNNEVNETGTLQLAAWQVLDDASYLTVSPASVSWSVLSGPITSITPGGLASAGPVYQDTQASVQGVFGGLAGTLNLTVIDSIPDNFGAYAGDGIPDSWQVQYFGLGTDGHGNPLGAANADFDGTGQTNLFKYLAGLNPTDGSRFTVTISAVPGQPGQMNITFTPYLAGRGYTVNAKTDLTTAGGWTPINGSAPRMNGNEATITDLSASASAKFYEVQITLP